MSAAAVSYTASRKATPLPAVGLSNRRELAHFLARTLPLIFGRFWEKCAASRGSASVDTASRKATPLPARGSGGGGNSDAGWNCPSCLDAPYWQHLHVAGIGPYKLEHPGIPVESESLHQLYISGDDGLTWRAGKAVIDLPKRGAMQPEVIELNDGRVMLILRNQLGIISKSYSKDGGDTWSAPESLGVTAPEAPATLRRIPSTGDLLLIWNNNYEPEVGHGCKRTPLTVAISSDEGKMWKNIRNLEDDPSTSPTPTRVSHSRETVR